MATQQGVWLGAIEKRIGATKKMLASIKAIKMMALSQNVSEALGKLRSLEFAASKLFRALIVGSLISCKSSHNPILSHVFNPLEVKRRRVL